jgi:antirestriction protein ArdC
VPVVEITPMARQDRAPRDGGARSSIYDDITSRIIAELEAGRLPWVQPWGTASAKAPLALPRNAATQRPYSGINILEDRTDFVTNWSG